MRAWIDKFKEVLIAVLPITLIVVLLGFTLVPLSADQMFRFLLGSFFIICGLTIFLVGVDISISPLGERLGEAIIRKNSLLIVIGAGLLLGFFISIAEPDLHILAGQIEFVTDGLIGKWSLLIIVSLGIAVMIAAGLVRSLYNIPLYILLTVLYGLIFLLAIFNSPEFLAISFDSSGATTGAMVVPFILAMALGTAHLKKDGKASEKDSFGLVSIASAGAIIAVLIRGIFLRNSVFATDVVLGDQVQKGILASFASQLLYQALEASIAILPMFLILLLSRSKILKLKKRQLYRMIRGFVLAWAGLVLLLAGVNAGFMDIGRQIGAGLAGLNNKSIVVIVGFALGFVTVLAEPAVHVLTRQIEDVTSGSVRRVAVLGALSLGIGAAIALSILRILIPGLQLWHILLPGYLIAIILAHVGAKLFVGIAFDSGGVASGPMTATFILAYAQGAAGAVQGANVLVDGFGVIALVALIPLITIQLLGILYRRKSLQRGNIDHV